MKEKVLQLLKPKVASYGFSQVSVDSVAQQVSETLSEDAQEEEINAKIDAVIPFFKISQSEITRIINQKKEKKDETGQKVVDESTAEHEAKTEPVDKFDRMTELINSLNERIDALASKEISKTRKQIYAEKIQYLPELLRKSMERKFERINFKDNDDFEAFLKEEELEIPNLVKEHSEEKLSETGRPRVGGKAPSKEASDKEVDKIINNLNI